MTAAGAGSRPLAAGGKAAELSGSGGVKGKPKLTPAFVLVNVCILAAGVAFFPAWSKAPLGVRGS